MVKLSEITKNSFKEVELSYGIIVTIHNKLTVEEQNNLGLTDSIGLSQNELAKRTPDVAFKLITAWNITDDKGEDLPLTFENFCKLPISFKEQNKIIGSCESLFMEDNKEKKDNGGA